MGGGGAGGTDSGQSSFFNDCHGLLTFRIMGRVSAGMTRYVVDLKGGSRNF